MSGGRSLVKLSVIVPVYNTGDYLRKCLDSLINQTLRDLEVICVDDGSTDSSWDVIQEFAKLDERVLAVRQKKNFGPSAARNKGMGLAKGEYIGFVDSDDYVDTTYFEELYRLAKEHKADIARGARVKVESGDKPLSADEIEKEEHYFNVRLDEAFDRGGKLNHYGIVWFSIYRRKMLQANKILFPRDVHAGEDTVFNIDASYFANKVVRSTNKDVLYHRVMRGESLMAHHVMSEDGLMSRALAIRAMIKALNTKPDYDRRVYVEHVCRAIRFFITRIGNITNEAKAGDIYAVLSDAWKKAKHKEDIYSVVGAWGVDFRSLMNGGNDAFLRAIQQARGAKTGMVAGSADRPRLGRRLLKGGHVGLRNVLKRLFMIGRRLLGGGKRFVGRQIRRAFTGARSLARILKHHLSTAASLIRPDKFILYRIIGNDLYPRHVVGQARRNVEFILKNEPAFKNVRKIFIVNRIFNKDEERAIIGLLKKHKAEYIVIPFDKDEYLRLGLDYSFMPKENFLASDDYRNMPEDKKQFMRAAIYRKKVLYTMHSNGARNFALAHGRKLAKWILPWDGNCYVTDEAWRQIQSGVLANKRNRYFTVPMARIADNGKLLKRGYAPEASEEPQIIFRYDAPERFNDAFPYGRREKVELLWRLGAPGKWNEWRDEFWDQPRRTGLDVTGGVMSVGWVARLFSGMGSMEKHTHQALIDRGNARNKSIIATIRHIDKVCSGAAKGVLRHYEYPLKSVSVRMQNEILDRANKALGGTGYTVMNKTTVAASGDKHDYISAALYWWPNPDTPTGEPYIWRDGEKAPGTVIGSPGSEQYDRTTIQRVFDDSINLALAWLITQDKKYATKGAHILNEFFLDPDTKMNPHLEYAQVRRGHNGGKGNSRGIIDFNDMYYYIDAVRIFEQSGQLTRGQTARFKEWLREYLDWLLTSPFGKEEMAAHNNHGTFYDVQVAAIADYLDLEDVLYETLLRAAERLVCQVREDGSQPYELSRKNGLHYCCYNIQAFTALQRIGQAYGFSFFRSDDRQRLHKAALWIIQSHKEGRIDNGDAGFDDNRVAILAHDYGLAESMASNKIPEVLSHDYALLPYWRLGVPLRD